jgi:hypothetical protein
MSIAPPRPVALAILVGLGGTVSLPSAAALDRQAATVELRWTGQTDLPHYVALVPEDHAWGEPLREAVLPAGESGASWQVPPGRYRAVCGAPRHQVVFLPIFAVEEGDPRNVECSPPPLVALTGEIRSRDDDRPVAGARIGLPHAFITDFSTKLSPAGEAFTRPDRSTTTDASGHFLVLGRANQKETLWIEAEGRAPGHFQDVPFPGGGGSLGVLRLDRGASLTVTIAPFPRGVSASLYVLALRQAGAALNEGERGLLSQRIWQRDLPADGASGTRAIRWPSLPPGSYSVLLKPADPHELPVELAAAALGVGQDLTVKIELPPAVATASSQPLAPATGANDLRLLARDAAGDDLELRRFDGSRLETAAATWRSVAGGRLAVVAAGCRAGVTYWLQGQHSISTAVTVQGDGCPSTLPLRLYSAAAIRGRLVAPSGSRLPAAAAVGVNFCSQPPGAPPVSAGSFPFVVRPGGVWAADVPAGCLSLAVAAAPFAPVTYRDRQTPAGIPTDLGIQSLVYGASLATRVLSEDGLPIEGAAVDLFPARDLARVAAASFAGRDLTPAAGGSTGSGGWVRLSGLPEGLFVLRVRTRDRPPLISDSFQLSTHLEVLLDDLRLPPPAKLQVVLRPSDELAALYSAYMVTVSGIGPPDWIQGAAFSLTAGKDHTVQFSRLVPGRWKVGGWARGRQAAFALKEQIVDLAAGPTSVELHLDAKVFHGKVTWHDAPVVASLDLRPIPPGRAAAQLVTEDDGTFTLPLERGGTYSATIQDRAGTLHATVAQVRFDDPAQLVEIRVPEGIIAGSVVDSQERPAAKAVIEAEQAIESPPAGDAKLGDLNSVSHRVMSDVAGAFKLDGLSAGSWVLSARLDDNRSDPVAVDLVEALPRDGVKLVLAEHAKISGHLVAASGEPVAGARIAVAYPPASDFPAPRYAMVLTDAQGAYEVEVLASPDSMVNLGVAAPGLPVTTFWRPLSAGALELQMAPAGGAVELDLATGSWQEFPPDLLVLMAADGSFIGSHSAGASPTASSLALTSLAAGRWSLVRVDSLASELALVLGAGRNLAVLGSFDVQPGQLVKVPIATLRP